MTEQNNTHVEKKEPVVSPEVEDNGTQKKKFNSIILPAALVGSIVLVGFLVAALYL